MSGATDVATPRLARAYRWCLKSYPKSYWDTVGDDVIALIAEVHANERHVLARECLSIVRAGLARRARLTRLKYWFPALLLAESAVALFFIGLAIRAVYEQHRSLRVSQIGADAIVLQLRTAWFLAYALPLLALAVLLSWLGVRAAQRIQVPVGERSGLSSLEVAVVLAQPVLLLAATVGPSLYQPFSVAEPLATAGLLGVGVLAIHQHRRLLQFRSQRAAFALALVCAGLPCLALGAAVTGGGGYSAGSNFADGFTNEIAVPTGGSLPVSVVCPAPGDCLVYGTSVLPLTEAGMRHFEVVAVSTGGDRWRAEPVPSDGSDPISTLACPTTAECYISGGIGQGDGAWPIARSLNGGRTWATLPASPPPPIENGFGLLACPAAQSCLVATNGGIAVTHDGGYSWAATLRIPAYHPRLLAISCPDARHCAVLADNGGHPSSTVLLYTSSDLGSDWIRHIVVSGAEVTANNLICTTRLRCLVGGYAESGEPALWLTSNGGNTWTQRRPAGVFPQACPTVEVCWAIDDAANGSRILQSEDGGLSWDRAADFPQGFRGLQFACATSESCTVVGTLSPTNLTDDAIISTTTGGRTWTAAKMPKLPARYLGRPSLLN